MKAIIPEISPELLKWRKRTGIDRWDEMWEGELHMAPGPNRTHQDFQFELVFWLRNFWAKPFGNRVHGEINLASIGGWPNDFRIPDLVLLKPEAFAIDHDEYFEGPPSVVVEIRSPGDESYEKLPFYARLGVPEVWIIDRDEKTPHLFVLAEGEYQESEASSSGWLESLATGILFREEAGGKLAIRLKNNPSSLRLLPEE
ncbi:MAG: Uma2 family endonuclease [Pirellulales bacterium]|nr:Uma2 family endonuclease [Pirellulales bacterium]